jgi:hypothetical protein
MNRRASLVAREASKYVIHIPFGLFDGNSGTVGDGSFVP